MKKILCALVFLFTVGLYAQDTYFNFGLGADVPVKKVNNGYQGSRFRMELELGERYFGFVAQPAFGNDAFSLFLGPRLMLPFQIGSRPIFIIPDFTTGIDFGFANSTVGLGLDFKFGFRAFYEFREGMAVSFRPFGMSIRPFNVWFGGTPNQSQISVMYEINAGFAYFF